MYILRDAKAPNFREAYASEAAAIARANELNQQWVTVGFPPRAYEIYYNGTGDLVTTYAMVVWE